MKQKYYDSVERLLFTHSIEQRACFSYQCSRSLRAFDALHKLLLQVNFGFLDTTSTCPDNVSNSIFVACLCTHSLYDMFLGSWVTSSLLVSCYTFLSSWVDHSSPRQGLKPYQLFSPVFSSRTPASCWTPFTPSKTKANCADLILVGWRQKLDSGLTSLSFMLWLCIP